VTLISYLSRTHFAEAAIEDALPEELGQVSRALLLVDDDDAANLAASRVQDALTGISLSVVRARSRVAPAVMIARLLEALTDIQSNTLIAVGGPEAIGLARLCAERARRSGAHLKVVAVPAGISDFGLSRRVRSSQGQYLACPRPDCIVADPTVLKPVESRRLAASAMEVLVHAVEAYASPGYNPPADAMAADAVRRITHWLPRALADPSNSEALRELLASALTAGLALEKAFGGVDAFAVPIHAELGSGLLHGAVHGPLMAAMAEFNGEAVGERYTTMAGYFANTDHRAHFSAEIGAFARNVGMPATLREIGVDRSQLGRLAEVAANDPAALANPRRLTSGDCRRILEAAW